MEVKLEQVKGIGPSLLHHFRNQNIWSTYDLILHIPRSYEDFTVRSLSAAKNLEKITIQGDVISSLKENPYGKVHVITFDMKVADDSISVVVFNRKYIMKTIQKNARVIVKGTYHLYQKKIIASYVSIVSGQAPIKPVYKIEGVYDRKVQHIIKQIFDEHQVDIFETIPQSLIKKYHLPERAVAYRMLHIPHTFQDVKIAERRFKYEEAFFLQLKLVANQLAQTKRNPKVYKLDRVKQFITSLPYTLTTDQKQATNDIFRDFKQSHSTMRLIQGDVGSGKTIVAALGMGIVVQNGAQAAFMAPTSILAEQHYASLKRLLASDTENAYLHENEIRLLIGDTPNSEREEILTGLADGTVKILVGTHALIEGPVVFKDLQMVVVDEQHRFGIAQRAALREKGENPHLLVMTATPIPRSLALTIYGDLDLSIMDEMPVGRQPVSTHILYPTERERVYTLIKAQVREGHQAFIIYPLVEQGENEERKAAVEEQERLQKDVFPLLRVGLLHGRLRPEEKETVMKQFRDQELDILVSTSVVEVGVDIPNATVMLIEGADRFGLAQLHQFRGRVGRGQDQSYCFLIPETKDAAENERLLAMKSTNDGFILAEYDLAQRGPGEFLGTRQSGYENLRLAKLTDIHLIEKAGQYAKQVFENDPELTAPEHQLMLNALNHFWLSGEGDLS